MRAIFFRAMRLLSLPLLLPAEEEVGGIGARRPISEVTPKGQPRGLRQEQDEILIAPR